jgi:hypothetical protein
MALPGSDFVIRASLDIGYFVISHLRECGSLLIRCDVIDVDDFTRSSARIDIHPGEQIREG